MELPRIIVPKGTDRAALLIRHADAEPWQDGCDDLTRKLKPESYAVAQRAGRYYLSVLGVLASHGLDTVHRLVSQAVRSKETDLCLYSAGSHKVDKTFNPLDDEAIMGGVWAEEVENAGWDIAHAVYDLISHPEKLVDVWGPKDAHYLIDLLSQHEGEVVSIVGHEYNLSLMAAYCGLPVEILGLNPLEAYLIFFKGQYFLGGQKLTPF